MPKKLTVIGTEITVIQKDKQDYISLTDMTKSFGDSSLVEKWLRNRNTIEFLGIWEQINNPDFNSPEFEGIKKESGLNRFSLSAKKWIEISRATGIIAKAGRYGGTYAHKDIAFEFGSWLSAEFKLYLIKEFQRLKDEESRVQSLEWSVNRTLAKVNYRIHTDAISENLIPPQVTPQQSRLIYANEADLLNMALFGKTAKQWREQNSDKKGNIRDYATIEQLIVLSNIESLNAHFISSEVVSSDRLQKLNEIAIVQMKSLLNSSSVKKLK